MKKSGTRLITIATAGGAVHAAARIDIPSEVVLLKNANIFDATTKKLTRIDKRQDRLGVGLRGRVTPARPAVSLPENLLGIRKE